MTPAGACWSASFGAAPVIGSACAAPANIASAAPAQIVCAQFRTRQVGIVLMVITPVLLVPTRNAGVPRSEMRVESRLACCRGRDASMVEKDRLAKGRDGQSALRRQGDHAVWQRRVRRGLAGGASKRGPVLRTTADAGGGTRFTSGTSPADVLAQLSRQANVQHWQFGLCCLGAGASLTATAPFAVHITTPWSAVMCKDGRIGPMSACNSSAHAATRETTS
jgi:hypothetical protein